VVYRRVVGPSLRALPEQTAAQTAIWARGRICLCPLGHRNTPQELADGELACKRWWWQGRKLQAS